MTLPREASRHHTVWISMPGRPASAERYAVDADRLVVFGDSRLGDLHEGDRVEATICEIHDGSPIVSFPVIVHELPATQVELGLFGEVMGNRPVATTWESARAEHRLLALQAA